jgi:mRNA-degrading endonuclease toxin of MazEF toxin-antitoxin module
VLISGEPAGLDVPSMALFDQICTVDIRRLIKRIGAVNPQTVVKAGEVIRISLGLDAD